MRMHEWLYTASSIYHPVDVHLNWVLASSFLTPYLTIYVKKVQLVKVSHLTAEEKKIN